MRRSLSIAAILVAGAAVAAAGEPLVAPLADGTELDLPPAAAGVQAPSPAAFLGYPLGTRFTHHERIVEYFEALAATSDRVALWEYGRTYEERPLQLAAISSAANIARLEELRQRHARLAEPQTLTPEELERLRAEAPIVVWLAYGVHGNESSSAEAAMATAWLLATAGGAWQERLEEAVVLIDPLANPDGRERYVHFYETHRGAEPDPARLAAEHWESWPGGRQNHYLVDLNRDWAWATQRETHARLAAYRRWEPLVYVDFHEMSARSTYFFPPAAEPIHPQINPRSVYWLEVFGRGNAAAFDRYGWTYYVGEKFDLFYPGYGDSYPSLRGAIGMTYEVAGHGRAGQALERSDGSLWTLADRIARHLTTSLATVATAVAHRPGLLADWCEGRRTAATRDPRTYLWDGRQPEARALAELLGRHGVEVRELATETRLEARSSRQGRSQSRVFAPGTLAVSTHGPLAPLVRSLMDIEAAIPAAFLDEQRQRLEENRATEFFDITAWSLPLAFHVEVWSADGPPPDTRALAPARHGVFGAGGTGFLTRPQGLAGYRFAAALTRRGLAFRLALAPFAVGGVAYPSGTLFVPRAGNPPGLDAAIAELAATAAVEVEGVSTALADAGVSLGSDSFVPVRPAAIGLLGGAGVHPTSLGFLWHLLDRQIEMPHHRLALAALDSIALDELDVLVMPDGDGWEGALDAAFAERLAAWLDDGGVLVAIGQAVEWLADRELVEVGFWEPPAPGETRQPSEVGRLGPERREIETPGAALATRLAVGHPLAAGVAAAPAVLFSGKKVLLPSGDPARDVLVADPELPLAAGFAWPEAEERLKGALLLGVARRGEGTLVLFAQDPAFRLFWRATAPLFLNSVLFGPSLQAELDGYR